MCCCSGTRISRCVQTLTHSGGGDDQQRWLWTWRYVCLFTATNTRPRSHVVCNSGGKCRGRWNDGVFSTFRERFILFSVRTRLRVVVRSRPGDGLGDCGNRGWREDEWGSRRWPLPTAGPGGQRYVCLPVRIMVIYFEKFSASLFILWAFRLSFRRQQVHWR